MTAAKKVFYLSGEKKEKLKNTARSVDFLSMGLKGGIFEMRYLISIYFFLVVFSFVTEPLFICY